MLYACVTSSIVSPFHAFGWVLEFEHVQIPIPEEREGGKAG